MSLYDDLGVPRDASPEAIKRAFRGLAMRAHPDRGGDPEQMQRINHAHDVLSDPERRARYDRTGKADDPQPLDSIAREHLAKMLDQFLGDEEDFRGDLVAHLRLEIDKAIRVNQAEIRKAEADIRRTERRKGRIAGAPMLEVLAAKRIEAGHRFITEASRLIEVCRRAKELTADMRDVEPVPVHAPDTSTFINMGYRSPWTL